ncbi:protein S40-6 [Typha latifolia]|uniref:protein S40-6 n=1 Tax=Typha latifolia TaxID=4733 RepID=UPI003C2C5F43
MAKPRRHSADRLLGTTYGYGYGYGHVRGPDLSELGEEDVWSTVEPRRTDPAWRAEPALSTRRWSPLQDRQVGGLSLAFEAEPTARRPSPMRQVATSAPVRVPEWSRFANSEPVAEEEIEEGEKEWVPPHEYLARASARAVATSVFEGVGRTLKGRDMSRVRDAVWSQTGFFG